MPTIETVEARIALSQMLEDEKTAERIGQQLARAFHIVCVGGKYLTANGNKTAADVARTALRIVGDDWKEG